MSILVGNAPCSWGTLEFDGTGSERFTYHQMLDELVATGYTGSELGDWGFMPTQPEALAEEFRARQIALTGAFVGVGLRNAEAHDEGETRVLQTAKLLAATADQLETSTRPFLVLADANGSDPTRTLFAGRIMPDMGLLDVEWEIFAAGAERMARRVQEETGLRTVFHPHCAGFIETPEEIAQLLAMTSPSLLGLVFDTGHYSYGAGGCGTLLDALDRFAERIWYIHYKDCDVEVLKRAKAGNWDYFEAVRQGVFCELGQGCVDFAAVTNWLRRYEYDGYITVEQDVLPGMGTPKESARRNRDYLLSIGV
jgi:inosose dehydratase